MATRIFPEEIKEAVKILRQGGVILYPTDTIWGIGCDATNEYAVDRVFEIKNRPANKSMIAIVDNPQRLAIYTDQMPDVVWDLLELTTEPLTVIYPNGKNLAPNAINEDGSIAFRVTHEDISNSLCYLLGKPIISTSANISGEPTPQLFSQITETIKSQVDYIIPFRQEDTVSAQPSKIIKIDKNGAFRIIR